MNIFSIKLYFNGSNEIVPIQYNDKLVSFLHNEILGKNNKFHSNTSLYSISPLFNSKTVKGGLLFDKGAICIIRTPSIEIFKEFYKCCCSAISKTMGFGLILSDVDFMVNDITDKTEAIFNTSPIFLGNVDKNSKPNHLTYKHGINETSAVMKRILLNKAKLCGYELNKNDFNIEFILDDKIKTKLVHYKGRINVTTVGSVKVSGSSNIIGLCFGLGVGLSSGCGFGFVFGK